MSVLAPVSTRHEYSDLSHVYVPIAPAVFEEAPPE
jgi:hypothetical protein